MADRLLARRLHLLQARLYGILDLAYAPPANLVGLGQAMIAGGVDVIQLRAKGLPPEELLALAAKVKPIFARNEALFIVNDHADVAREADADGLHIGQDDGTLADIRARLHTDQIVGRSTHSVEQAVAAEAEGADYLGVGPIFATPTKPDYTPVGLELIGQVRKQVAREQFCIGGIKRENLRQVLAAGATRVVVVSGILQAGSLDEVTAYCRELKNMLETKAFLA